MWGATERRNETVIMMIGVLGRYNCETVAGIRGTESSRGTTGR